ncbi:hypothetical protein DSCO28_33390 [Desulfosarcina ovata subsp. sediminis]|uniref:Glycosyltransferase 2-like domain-containing protein n=1 Tax=Desulfosarcina ovata subsp. sediminis TaxID=885957 RepID=A0A5K7ZRT8_9BACT|nr:hypothetical protein DSCO28_33390 [Desulfosarcina ovata subsp. sediminis]
MVSIVVCTYNRCDLLFDTLANLCQQSLDPASYEIVVVDNNSSDQTQAVSLKFCDQFPNVRYVMESRQGLSHARNCGLMTARGSYVGYIDDDCLIPKGFLEIAVDIIQKKSPDVFGGPSYAFYRSPKPTWYKNRYGANAPYTAPRYLRGSTCENIFGCNMFFKRESLKQVGGFDPKLGMSGKKIFYGEEVSVIKRIEAMRSASIIYYDPKLYLYHLVQAERMKIGWFFRMFIAQGGAAYYLAADRGEKIATQPLGRMQLLRRSLSLVKQIAGDLLRGLCFRDRHRYPYIQNYIVEHTKRYLLLLGRLHEQYKDHV